MGVGRDIAGIAPVGDKYARSVRHTHVPELQAVRGIAATMVVVHHTSFFFATSAALRKASVLFVNAHAAVVTFFVLSGFVLTQSLARRELNRAVLWRFYATRFFRIYPALWIACLALFLYYAVGLRLASSQGTSGWFHALGDIYPRPKLVLATLAGQSRQLISPFWSIQVEIIVSLLLPAMAAAVRRGLPAQGLMLMLSLVAATLFRRILVAHHLWSFALGACFGAVLPAIPACSSRTNRIVAVAALAVLLFFRTASPAWRLDTNYDAVIPNLVEGVAATVLLGCIVRRPADFGFLRARAIYRLGDVSYSLYLLHWPVMLFLGKGIILSGWLVRSPDLRAGALLVGTLAFSIPVAIASYRWIELGGIALGKRMVGSASTPIGAART